MKLAAMMLLCTATMTAAAQQPSLTGKWTATVEAFGTPQLWQMKLEQTGDALTGNLAGDVLQGTVNGGTMHFLAKDTEGGSEEVTATLKGDTLTGSVIWINGSAPQHPSTRVFSALRNPVPVVGTPRTHEFEPTVFRRDFSSLYAPVLTVNAGDTIHTWTVDAGGVDPKGVPRSLGGNPQTGPFYVAGASPGDVLAVHIQRLRLNRDYASSTNGIVARALSPGLAQSNKDASDVRWKLDIEQGLATPEMPGEHMKGYTVPVHPMLGCVAVAASADGPAPRSGDSGWFGGNMDFNEIVEGATVYLPVRVPGAMLYFGDGHAVQGDGETTGDALETSMDVTVTVDVIPNKHLAGPRVESATQIMALGLNGSIDDAFKEATDNMADWLMTTYKLTPKEFAMVLGTAAEYKVAEVADRNANVVLKISKERLSGLSQ